MTASDVGLTHIDLGCAGVLNVRGVGAHILGSGVGRVGVVRGRVGGGVGGRILSRPLVDRRRHALALVACHAGRARATGAAAPVGAALRHVAQRRAHRLTLELAIAEVIDLTDAAVAAAAVAAAVLAVAVGHALDQLADAQVALGVRRAGAARATARVVAALLEVTVGHAAVRHAGPLDAQQLAATRAAGAAATVAAADLAGAARHADAGPPRAHGPSLTLSALSTAAIAPALLAIALWIADRSLAHAIETHLGGRADATQEAAPIVAAVLARAVGGAADRRTQPALRVALEPLGAAATRAATAVVTAGLADAGRGAAALTCAGVGAGPLERAHATDTATPVVTALLAATVRLTLTATALERVLARRVGLRELAAGIEAASAVLNPRAHQRIALVAWAPRGAAAAAELLHLVDADLVPLVVAAEVVVGAHALLDGLVAAARLIVGGAAALAISAAVLLGAVRLAQPAVLTPHRLGLAGAAPLEAQVVDEPVAALLDLGATKALGMGARPDCGRDDEGECEPEGGSGGWESVDHADESTPPIGSITPRRATAHRIDSTIAISVMKNAATGWRIDTSRVSRAAPGSPGA